MSEHRERRAAVDKLTARIIDHNRQERRYISQHEAQQIARRAERQNRRIQNGNPRK